MKSQFIFLSGHYQRAFCWLILQWAVEHEEGDGETTELPGEATVLEEAPYLQEASEA